MNNTEPIASCTKISIANIIINEGGCEVKDITITTSTTPEFHKIYANNFMNMLNSNFVKKLFKIFKYKKPL